MIAYHQLQHTKLTKATKMIVYLQIQAAKV